MAPTLVDAVAVHAAAPNCVTTPETEMDAVDAGDTEPS